HNGLATLGSGVTAARQPLELFQVPVRIRAPQFRLAQVRTCVRATDWPTLYRGRGQEGRRGVALLRRGAAPARHVPDRQREQDTQEVRRDLGISTDHFDPYGRQRGSWKPQ